MVSFRAMLLLWGGVQLLGAYQSEAFQDFKGLLLAGTQDFEGERTKIVLVGGVVCERHFPNVHLKDNFPSL